MKYLLLNILFLLLFSNEYYSQNCGIDSTLCYSYQQYPGVTFGAQQSFQSVPNTVVFQTPLVADINADCVPEIIIAGTTGFLANPRITSGITVLNSTTGAAMTSFPTVYYSWSCPLSYAIADINLDGFPEIIVAAANHTNNPVNLRRKLVCYDFSGNVLWVSNQTYGNNSSMQFEGTPSLADFNQDGIAEVYVQNQIFNAQTGILLADGGANGIGRMTVVAPYYEICLTAAADLDSNPNDLELAAGYTIYNVQISNTTGSAGNSMTAYNINVDGAFRDGMTSFGDINLDGKLDVVISSEGTETTSRLYSYYLNNVNVPVLIAKTPMPRGTTAAYSTFCGAPFVGDLDGLGIPSICVTRNYRLVAYTYNGTTTFQQKWVINTIDQSGATGITSFDFDQNGIQELVFRDEQDMRIINGNGSTPTTLSIIPCSSPTVNDMAIVADIDNSGTSKICVTCGNNNLAKLKVYESNASVPWAPSRKIWNQYGYHVFNINDDATVPQFQLNNATSSNGERNNYFVQASLLDINGNTMIPAADVFGSINCITNNQITNEIDIEFEINNDSLASQTILSGLNISFFNGNPETNGTLIGSTNYNFPISPGVSVVSNFQIPYSSSLNGGTIYMVLNNDGLTSGVNFQPQDFEQIECNYQNNIDSNLIISINAGSNVTNCGLIPTTLNATNTIGYTGNWQNISGTGNINNLSSPNAVFTPNTYGQTILNWVVGNSNCISGLDEIIITAVQPPAITPAPDVVICQSDSVQIGVNYTANYNFLWSLNSSLSSPNIEMPIASPDQITEYTLMLTDPITNCSNFDTLIVDILPSPIYSPVADFVVCAGDSITLSYLPYNLNIYTWSPMNFSGPEFSGIVDSAMLILVSIENPSTGCVVIDSIIGTTSANIDNDLLPFEICVGDSFSIQLQDYSNVDYFISTDSINFNVYDSTAFYSPNGDGFYIVQSLISNSICFNIDTLFFTVNSLPIVNGGPDQIICFGSATMLSGSGAESYSWTNNVLNNVQFTPSQTDTYTVTGNDLNGCLNSDTVLIQINPIPMINAGADQSICLGDSVILNATSGLPVTWNNGVMDGVPFIPTISGNYIASVTDFNSCMNTDLVNILVNPIPIVNAGADQTICSNSSITLTASGAATYQWDNGFINGVAFIPTSDSVQVYTVIGTSVAGCTDTDQLVLILGVSPDINAGLDTLICEGESYFLNAVSGSSGTIQWNNNFNNGAIIYPNLGTNIYVAEITSSNGCVGYDTVLVQVIPNPDASFNFYPNEITESNTTINFFNTSENATDYEWFFNQTDISYLFSPTYLVQSIETNGLFVTLIVTNEIGCLDSITVFIPYNEYPVVYVPNCFTPDGDEFNNTFNVVYSGSISQVGYELLIFDRWGELIFESHNIEIGWDGTYLGRLVQDGTYTWKLKYLGLQNDFVYDMTGHVTVIR